MEPLTDVRDISRIAYGFMASKALFTAIKLDVFSQLSSGAKTLHELAAETGAAPNRLGILLSACLSLGLLIKDEDRYRNAPASERYLVRNAPACFSDYYQFQIDRQFYRMLERLDAGLSGDSADAGPRSYEAWMADREEAEAFTRGQHAGSLGPAYMLAKRVDLSGQETLLDVGGGSGAFSITLCQDNPALKATILDFPNVIDSAERFVAAANLTSRIGCLGGNALDTDWPKEQDVILMSYLVSAVGMDQVPVLIEKAWSALKPGGQLIVHDFMLNDERTGPTLAALWFVPAILINPDCVPLTPSFLTEALGKGGFRNIVLEDLIVEITQLALCEKPT